MLSDSESSNRQESGERPAHLFVLIHGLWGSPDHLSTIERLLNEALPECSQEQIVTMKPRSFRFWKSYDGIELNSKKVTQELFYEIESLKEKNNLKVTKISFVGYSLGGLIARYVIGLLEELDFFDNIEPVFFTTFASPHVGIKLFGKNAFEYIANKSGPYLFGQSGAELFIADNAKILVQLAQPNSKYYRGLLKFQKLMLLASIKNDRTVAFFTSYICEYSPFGDDWNKIKVKYLKDLPEASVASKVVKPKFVDLTRTRYLSDEDMRNFRGNIQEEPAFIRRNIFTRALFIFITIFVFLPFWTPFSLIACSLMTLYSSIKIKIVHHPDLLAHWMKLTDSVYGTQPVDPEDAKKGEQERCERQNLAKHHHSVNEETSDLTYNMVERMLYTEDRVLGKSLKPGLDDTDDSSSALNGKPKVHRISHENHTNEPTSATVTSTNGSLIDNKVVAGKLFPNVSIKINYDQYDEIARKYTPFLKSKDYESFPTFTEKTRLPVGEDRKFIIDSLNELDWIKIPVYLDVLNAHDAIVSRRGPKIHSKGTANVGLWVSILRNHLVDEQGHNESN